MESIVLGGGCFWCIEAVFEQVKGITSIVSGYAGGSAETANYKDVSAGNTAHIEVIKLVFDTNIITLSEILDIFWTVHDPTTPNRQGNDVGAHYRSAIFYSTEKQKSIAEQSIKEVATPLYDDPVVTELIPLIAFFSGEGYHQNYYAKTGDSNPYCTFVITPKVSKLRAKFADKLKES